MINLNIRPRACHVDNININLFHGIDVIGRISQQVLTNFSWGSLIKIFAPAGFWPRGQNPRRHPRVPRVYVYTYKRNNKKVLKKCVGSMEILSIC